MLAIVDVVNPDVDFIVANFHTGHLPPCVDLCDSDMGWLFERFLIKSSDGVIRNDETLY